MPSEQKHNRKTGGEPKKGRVVQRSSAPRKDPTHMKPAGAPKAGNHIVWMGSPSEKQKEFLHATSRFVAYGGSRGGGKSWAVGTKAVLLCGKYIGIKVLVLRRTYPDLRENHILPLLFRLDGVARYRDIEKVFVFPNGSRIKFGYCDGESDLLQYQGREYDVIFIDEATQFEEEWFWKLTACLRGVNNFPKRMYLTCNPGGVGHAWVKRLFIDRQFRNVENPDDFQMIRASVYDNKALLKRDAGYLSFLEKLPDRLRRAWLDGDWNLFTGQYFTSFRQEIHVIRPFTIPAHWRRYITLDYGLDMLACYWVAVDEAARATVYRELYESGLVVSEAARAIRENTDEEIFARYAPPDLWNRHSDSGFSTADLFSREGVELVKVSNRREQGWYNLHEWLRPVREEAGKKTARLRIFDTCQNLIRTLPALRHDDKNPNDCAREPHELTHAPDALRYFVSGYPMPPDSREEEEPGYARQAARLLEYGR